MISHPESDGNIAESPMVLSSFDSHTHNISGLCFFNKVDKSACLLSDTRLFVFRLIICKAGTLGLGTWFCLVVCSGSVISCDSDKTEKLFDKYVMESDWLITVLEYCNDPQGGHTHIAELPFIFSYCDGDTLTHFMRHQKSPFSHCSARWLLATGRA